MNIELIKIAVEICNKMEKPSFEEFYSQIKVVYKELFNLTSNKPSSELQIEEWLYQAKKKGFIFNT